jgi:gluconate kinase
LRNGNDDDRDRWLVRVASSCMHPISSVDAR